MTKLTHIIEHIKTLTIFDTTYYNHELGEPHEPASSQAVQDAITFVSNLDFDWIPTPSISLAAAGGIDLWWSFDNLKLGIDFYGDNTYSYYGKTIFNKDIIKCFSGDGVDANIPLLPDLLKELLLAGYTNRIKQINN
jgi:hypothetical protein